MKIRFLPLLLSALIIAGCGATKNVAKDSRLKADQLFNEGSYAEALALYNQIPYSAKVDTSLYRCKSIANSKTGQHAEACRLAAFISWSGDSLLIDALAVSLTDQKREYEVISLLEENKPQFEQTWGKDSLVVRLATYYNNVCDDKLVDLYPEISKATVRSECFKCYLKKVKDTKKSKELTKICQDALKDNPNQDAAIRQLAIMLYDDAEQRYRQAMMDYNKNKNATTYAYLKRDLKRISQVYVDSRDKFEKLRSMGVAEENDLLRLVNIYNRLDQKEKAKAIEKLIK
ncbi:MAG: hypothetical protein HUJ96_07730 [Marinilabiliaceae bacterium]|nr:hypothetical protein [Marinilabiliaceae bacterium]